MKQELSSFELLYLVQELQEFVRGKIDKIYQPNPKELVISVHLPNKGKRWLRIVKGAFLLVTQEKGAMPEKPTGFCVYLRKRLENSRITSITQLGFERIVEIALETRQAPPLVLIIELFGKGNVILCTADRTILQPMEIQKMKERAIQAKGIYQVPRMQKSIDALDEKEIMEKVNTSAKGSVVKALAVEFSLGGLLAEELCLRAGIPKETKKITTQQAGMLVKSVQSLFKEKPSPALIYREGKLIDAVPAQMHVYNADEKRQVETFSQALETVLLQRVGPQQEPEKLKKLRTLIEMQTKQLSELQHSAEENQRKGELIYEQYGVVKEILETMKAARKQMSWQEIKQKLKEGGKGKLVSVNEKENSIVVEI